MIQNITLNKVATYKNKTTLTTDKKVNLIYGLNGVGKSTLSRFLQSPQSPEFANCSFIEPIDTKILVYNQKFINETFFESDEIKGAFSLSKENKEIETKLNQKKSEINEKISELSKIQENIANIKKEKREKNEKAIEKTWEIKKKYAEEDRTLIDFLKNRRGNKQELYNFVHDWKKPEREPKKTIEQIKSDYISLTKSSKDKEELIKKLSFNVGHIENHEIFKTAILGSKSSTVSGLISSLNNSDWVRKGLSYIDKSLEETQTCPFCQKSTLDKSLVDEIFGYFDKTYDEAVEKLDSFHKQYADAIEKLPTVTAEAPNRLVIAHWQEIKSNYDQLIATATLNTNIISEKENSLSEKKPLHDTSEIVRNINDKISEANSIISDHNRRLDNKSEETRKLRDEFWDLIRWHYDQTISRLDSDLLDCEERTKKEIKKHTQKQSDKSDLESQIKELQSKTVNIEKAITAINNNLISLGITDFSIKKHNDVLYRIVREDHNSANIRTLSEGEKTIITFLYFLEMCKGKSSPNEVENKKIAVIDDPISSLSHIYI